MKPHKLPLQEDVTEINLGGTRVGIVRLTPENRLSMAELAMSMYLGEHCKYCGKEYRTLDDLRATVWAGYHERGRLACEKCWNENNPGATP